MANEEKKIIAKIKRYEKSLTVDENDIALNMIKSIPASNIKKVEIIANPDSKYEANNKNGIISRTSTRNSRKLYNTC